MLLSFVKLTWTSFWEFFIILPPDSIVMTKHNISGKPEAVFRPEAAEMKGRGFFFDPCDRRSRILRYPRTYGGSSFQRCGRDVRRTRRLPAGLRADLRGRIPADQSSDRGRLLLELLGLQHFRHYADPDVDRHRLAVPGRPQRDRVAVDRRRGGVHGGGGGRQPAHLFSADQLVQHHRHAGAAGGRVRADCAGHAAAFHKLSVALVIGTIQSLYGSVKTKLPPGAFRTV